MLRYPYWRKVRILVWNFTSNIPATEIKAKVESAIRTPDVRRMMRNSEKNCWFFTPSFNRQNYWSLKSWRNSKMPLRAWKRTTPSWFSRRIKVMLASPGCWHVKPRCQSWSSRKNWQTMWVRNYPRSCSTWSEMGTYQRLFTTGSELGKHNHPILPPVISNIPSPLTCNSGFTVKNSAHFASIISSEKIQDHNTT